MNQPKKNFLFLFSYKKKEDIEKSELRVGIFLEKNFYSTVTLFARFLGLSTSRPSELAI